MANRKQLKMTESERRRRHFSDSFKLQKVREIETGLTKISEICKEYEVSGPAVYQWIKKFGIMKEKKEKLIVETESDTKKLIALKKRVADLERLIGQKQIEIEFKDKMIALAEEVYKIDIKKKISTQRSNTSGGIENNTDLV